jgi:hypothetical protein
MIFNVKNANSKVIVIMLMLLVLVIVIQQVYTDSVSEWILPVNAQTENGTFALWRINAAVPGEQVEVSIADDTELYTYTFTLPNNLTTHPNNPQIKYYDFHTYLPITLKENEMAIMCVIPLGDDSQGYQCTEIFVTKDMARGIVYYNFNLEGNAPGFIFT